MTAEPLDNNLVSDLMKGVVSSKDDINKRSKYLADVYGGIQQNQRKSGLLDQKEMKNQIY